MAKRLGKSTSKEQGYIFVLDDDRKVKCLELIKTKENSAEQKQAVLDFIEEFMHGFSKKDYSTKTLVNIQKYLEKEGHPELIAKYIHPYL